MFFKRKREIDPSNFATREELITAMELQVKVNESTNASLHAYQEYIDTVHNIINVQRKQISMLENVIKELVNQQGELIVKVAEIEKVLYSKEVKNEE